MTRVRGTRRLCGSEPNRLRAIGQPVTHPLYGTESKLFLNGTKEAPAFGRPDLDMTPPRRVRGNTRRGGEPCGLS
ncbi:hypothetical protein GCM10010259_05550 [Streptomyces daghestanicus]|uniref:Uncharacterized protein n=2 Tax=Streptomyces TaxID=1883 RepID=A0A918GE26_STRGD|nr:hypothetical protein GCM10010238_19490 [Streptomyces niveoruber]GGS82943.1 hypothetical protein GCM10010240_15460 [Streptomyces griseoviridis]GGU18174.1 hypothetical protein GCM10010259_05550 [Streptomyces daghestanicus]GHI33754.1 hypothetical protein Sdagh_54840 [Streptomyces daghestanicus]